MGAMVLGAALAGAEGEGQTRAFGPENPFYAESTLPFHAPPFDRIKDSDYEPAFDAGMAEELKEMMAIADDSAAPTFENTLVAMEKAGQLYDRVSAAFSGVTGANTNPELERIQALEAPKMAAHRDAIYLNAKLFHRVETIYQQIGGDKMDSLGLDAESKRLVDIYYKRFVHAGANLSAEDKEKLKKLNEEESSLSNAFRSKVLAATKAGAFATTDRAALKGLSDAELAAAAAEANARGKDGYLLPMRNTTQQPMLASLEDRGTRQAILESSWNRAEHGDANDTRATVARLAKLRAEKAALLGFPTYAAWKLEDQMAKTPEAAMQFMDALAPVAAAKAEHEARDIQKLIDTQDLGNQNAGFKLEPWDWEFYAEQVRKARYDLDESEVKPYFEINSVLEDGVFYAATLLYGITFKERHDIPVWNADVRVFDVIDSDGKPLALFYCDNFKRDNKSGGAWMSSFVQQTKLLGKLPVIYNVANLPKPAAGEPALISFDDVTTMFHEFGHALHGMFSDVRYPLLSGTGVPRDFVEFPSQFNERWALEPGVFSNYAKHYKTGEAMPADLVAKIQRSQRFNEGYALAELLAAAQLDMQWHTLPASAAVEDPDAFERAALERKHMLLAEVPPRYRSSYFSHIWVGGYSAGYYAYLWSEMLDDDAWQWFEDHGGLTRVNGDRLRRMVLSRGNTEELGPMYAAWLGDEPVADPMLKTVA